MFLTSSGRGTFSHYTPQREGGLIDLLYGPGLVGGAEVAGGCGSRDDFLLYEKFVAGLESQRRMPIEPDHAYKCFVPHHLGDLAHTDPAKPGASFDGSHALIRQLSGHLGCLLVVSYANNQRSKASGVDIVVLCISGSESGVIEHECSNSACRGSV